MFHMRPSKDAGGGVLVRGAYGQQRSQWPSARALTSSQCWEWGVVKTPDTPSSQPQFTRCPRFDHGVSGAWSEVAVGLWQVVHMSTLISLAIVGLHLTGQQPVARLWNSGV